MFIVTDLVYLRGVSPVDCSWPNIEDWLGSFVIFQEIGTSFAKKLYSFVVIQGAWTPVPPSGSAHNMTGQGLN